MERLQHQQQILTVVVGQSVLDQEAPNGVALPFRQVGFSPGDYGIKCSHGHNFEQCQVSIIDIRFIVVDLRPFQLSIVATRLRCPARASSSALSFMWDCDELLLYGKILLC